MEFDRFVFEQPLYDTVNVYRFGETLLDTAHPANREAFLEQVVESTVFDDVERVVLTHPHIDHVGATLTIRDVATLPHVVPSGVPEILHGYNDYLECVHEEIFERTVGFPEGTGEYVADTYFPTDSEYLVAAIDVVKTLEDGETFQLGPYECEAIHTPGHVEEHLSYWHEPSGTLCSADLVSPNGHFMYGPLTANVQDYIDSLRRIRRLEPDLLLPGHGPPISDVDARIADAIEKAHHSRRRIREAVEEAAEPSRAATLARDVFDASDATVGFLTFVVCGYLEDLERDGVLTVQTTEEGVLAETNR